MLTFLNLLFLVFSLLVIDNQCVKGDSASTCPYKLLESAFKVRVDLDQHLDNGTQPIVCSDAEKSGLGELIEKGIQKASQMVVEKSRFLSLDESNASVCKAPQEGGGESRRLKTHMVRGRKLIFRYYGGMRCRLCGKDNNDQVITRDDISRSLCSQSWKTSPRTLKVPIPGKQGPRKVVGEHMDLNFVLRELGGFQGQHMFVAINNATVDLGAFYEIINEGERAQKIDGLAWNMKPELTNNPMDQWHNITMNVSAVLFRDKEYLDVKLTLGDEDGQELSAAFGTKVCYFFQGYTDEKRRRLISSPVSSPTISSSYSSPVSGPVVAEDFKIEEENIMMPKGESFNFEKKADISDDNNNSLLKPSSHSQNTAVNNNKGNNMDTSGGSKPPETKSESNNGFFQFTVEETLRNILNTDLKVAVSSKAGHCMYGKKIKAIVHLTPKPEWEKNLPTCTNKVNQ